MFENADTVLSNECVKEKDCKWQRRNENEVVFAWLCMNTLFLHLLGLSGISKCVWTFDKFGLRFSFILFFIKKFIYLFILGKGVDKILMTIYSFNNLFFFIGN